GLQGPGERRHGQRPDRVFAGAQCANHGNESARLQRNPRQARSRQGGCRGMEARDERRMGNRTEDPMSAVENTIGGAIAELSGDNVTGFLTDSTLCIGCKACEVACKEWNQIGDDGFDWTGTSY